MKLRKQRHLIDSFKEESFVDFNSEIKFVDNNKSYCNNLDLFFDAPLPRQRKMSTEEYKRQAEFLRTLCRESYEKIELTQNLQESDSNQEFEVEENTESQSETVKCRILRKY